MHRGVFGYPVVNTPGSLGSLVVNTPGSPDSAVMNTPGSLDFLVYLVSASELVYKKSLMPNTAVSHNSTVYSLQRSLYSQEYLAPASVFANQFWSTLWCIYYQGVSTLRSWVHLGAMTPQRWIHLGVSTPGSRYIDTPGSWLWIWINFTNIPQYSKSFLGMSGKVVW